jgi:hypothetical protein
VLIGIAAADNAPNSFFFRFLYRRNPFGRIFAAAS